MDEPVNNIREINRSLLNINRRTHRDEINDIRRPLQNSASSENVMEIIEKLKTKASISARELNLLKNALLEDPSNVENLLNVHGALRGLVRELTGSDVRKQCAAAGCCCNLAMDSSACVTLVKATGSYLVAAVDNFATEFAVTCIWTIGNLAASGTKVCDILISQGALSKISEPQTHMEVQEACWYSLKHFAFTMGDGLRSDILQKILHMITRSKVSLEASQVLFILSCHTDFNNFLTEELVTKLLEMFSSSAEKHLECVTKVPCCEFVYVSRTLANTNTVVYQLVLNFLIDKNLCGIFRKVLSANNKIVNDSLLWLLGNIYNNCDSSEFFNLLTR